MERLRWPGPRARDRGAGSKGYSDAELLKVLRAKADGRTLPEIALLFWKPELVAAEWHDGGWMHNRLKRRLRRARATMKRYREIAAGV